MTSMFEIFKKRNWFSIISLLITFFALLLAYKFHEDSKSYRKPVFFLDPIRTEIVRTDRIDQSLFEVIKKDTGNRITGNVTSVRFSFINIGDKPIKNHEILKPIKITLADPASEIIDYKITAPARKVTKFSLKRSADSNRSLLLEFLILEKGDGIVAQIIYEGDPNTQIAISGIIEGVSEFLLDPTVNISYLKYRPYFIIYFIPLILLILFYKPMDPMVSHMFDYAKEKQEFSKSNSKRYILWLSVNAFIFILLTIFMVYFVILLKLIADIIGGVDIPVTDYLDL